MRRFNAVALSHCPDFPLWQFQHLDKRVTLIQSGIGIRKAAKAAAAAVKLKPRVIISAGFCGALSPGAELGELYIAEKLYSYPACPADRAVEPEPAVTARIGNGIKRGNFITTEIIIEKAEISARLPELAGINLLEMESSSIAAVCASNGIEFAAIRSVTDTADHDPARLFRETCNKNFEISIARAVLSIIKNPALLPGFLKLSKNAAIAGKSLAAGIESALERS